jgi:hypothetical protein
MSPAHEAGGILSGQSDCRQWNLDEASLVFSNVPHPRHGLLGCRRLLNANQKTSCPIRPYYNVIIYYLMIINSFKDSLNLRVEQAAQCLRLRTDASRNTLFNQIKRAFFLQWCCVCAFASPRAGIAQ